MSNEPEVRPDVSAMKLFSGIVSDVRVLVEQQLSLVRLEIQGEIGRAKDGSSIMAVGFAVLIIGGVVFCGMLVHLLAQIPGLPLWGCYGLVGVPIVLLGAGLCHLGAQKLRSPNASGMRPVRTEKE